MTHPELAEQDEIIRFERISTAARAALHAYRNAPDQFQVAMQRLQNAVYPPKSGA